MRISDWSSDVCSSDLLDERNHHGANQLTRRSLELTLIERHVEQHADQIDSVFVNRAEEGHFRVNAQLPGDRKSVVEGKRLSVRVDPGGRRIIKTTIPIHRQN